MLKQLEYLKEISDKQNLTAYMLSEINESIEVKSLVEASSFRALTGDITCHKTNLNKKHATLLEILDDIKKRLFNVATRVDIDELQEIRDYDAHVSKLKILWQTYTKYLKFNTTFSRAEFDDQCRSSYTKPSTIVNFIMNKFREHTSQSALLKESSLLKAFISNAKHSLSQFEVITKSVLDQMSRALLIHLICLKSRRVDALSREELDDQADANLKEIVNTLTLAKYQMASSLVQPPRRQQQERSFFTCQLSSVIRC